MLCRVVTTHTTRGLCRVVAQCRGVLTLSNQLLHRANHRHNQLLLPHNQLLLPHNQLLHRHISAISTPSLLPRVHGIVNHQSCRSVYNPFNTFDEEGYHHDDHDIEEKPNLQQKRKEKRRKLQQSRHSTHSHFDELEETSDSVLFSDVRVVGWSPTEIYNVVMNVAEYKEFIPYCIKSDVFTQYSSKRHDFMEAELQVGFQLYQLNYTSKVDGSTTLDGKKIVTAVCENKSLFDHLNMEWIIAPGPKEHTSSMHFNVSFKFCNKLYNTVAGLFQSSVIAQMIPAFESRLREIHGEPTIFLSSLSASKVPRRNKRR